MKGKLVMIDGLDGSGKGVFVDAIVEWAKEKGLKVFDMRKFFKEEKRFPEYEEIKDYDVILSGEPTYAWVGTAIREEMIRSNNRKYSALSTAHAYSLDRELLYKRLLVPLLEAGKLIFQERGVVTSIAYQPLQAELDGDNLPLERVISFAGNRFTLEEFPPDILVIVKCSAETVMDRLDKRTEKKDKCNFEKLNFQKLLEERYYSDWLKELFEKQGSKVIYLDTNPPKTPEQTEKAAIEIAESLL